jgi:RimJ/RimL family protein N-acetyltransferase
MVENEKLVVNCPILETERLRLRMFRNDDFESYAEFCADPEVMRYLTGSPMTRLEASRHMAMLVGHWALLGYGAWAVEEKSTGKFVGRVGFNDFQGWPAFEIGWTLGRQHWGKGYASEAARVALDYAFNELGREHVISLIRPENLASIAVAEKLGEKLEGETEVMGFHVLVYGVNRPA